MPTIAPRTLSGFMELLPKPQQQMDMMRSICCWGAGRSSIKPDSVRGVIFAIKILLFG